ncbi:MAG TPA: hypothetical protein PLV42_07485 [bacterium]|nr:hypothetical protein [bacterium]
MIRIFVAALIGLLLFTGCIALKQDVDVAKAECVAENVAKRKVLEEALRADLAAITERLRKIEDKLNIDKTAQENKMNLSFSTLDDLKNTIRDINSRIDSIDVGSNKAAAELAPTVKRLTEQYDAMAKELALLRAGVEEQKPVDHVTIDKNGTVRLPDAPEKAFAELQKMSTDAAIAPQVRDGWTRYIAKFPGRHDCEAVFYTGETFSAEKAWNSAIEQYRRIDTEYKGCVKHEISYLRIAAALISLGKKDYAKKVVLGMRDIFPTTEYPKMTAELEKKLGLPPREKNKDKQDKKK